MGQTLEESGGGEKTRTDAGVQRITVAGTTTRIGKEGQVTIERGVRW